MPQFERPRPDRRRSRAGLTFIEALLAMSVAGVVFSGLYSVVIGMRSYFDQTDVRAKLEDDGRQILRTMISELRQTGIVEGGSVNYPAIYERPLAAIGDANQRGALIATLSLHDSDLGGQVFNPSQGTRANLYRSRPSTELVFKHLQVTRTTNQNLRPVLDHTTGQILWGSNEYSYLCTIGPAGIPQLERRVNGDSPRVIGRYVYKVVFESISHDPTVFYDQIIIVLYMRQRVGGQLIEVDLEGTVNLRNTKEID